MTKGDKLWQPVLKTTPEQSLSPVPKKAKYLTPLDQPETPTPFRLLLFYFFVLAALVQKVNELLEDNDTPQSKGAFLCPAASALPLPGAKNFIFMIYFKKIGCLPYCLQSNQFIV